MLGGMLRLMLALAPRLGTLVLVNQATPAQEVGHVLLSLMVGHVLA